MQGRKNYTEKLFTSFQLSDRVPKDNLYRRLRESLDLNSIYKDTKELYGSTGNPSIDPRVFPPGGPIQTDAHRVPRKHYLRPEACRALRDADGHSLLFGIRY